MSKDTIYREDAIKAIEELPNAYNGWSDTYDKAYIIGTLEEVPNADRPQGEWIPCSERLPENGHYYLWCSDMGRVQSDYYWDGFEKGQKYGYNIVAWMPLPKPWKGADDE